MEPDDGTVSPLPFDITQWVDSDELSISELLPLLGDDPTILPFGRHVPRS